MTLAWHFVGDTLRDGTPVPPDGETLRHDGELVMCRSGLHASERIIDALDYAPGPIICRVRCGGKVERSGDKLVCTERTILWRVEGTDLLREFARQCASDVAHLSYMPGRLAANYANAAASAAARAATRAAPYIAAAAASAAGYATDAARHAVAASWDATGDAARDAQNERLTGMVEAAQP